MAITDKEQGVWSLDEVYNKQMEGDIWDYTEIYELFSWGYGQSGARGQNNTTQYSSPIQIPGTSWKQVYHSKSQFAMATRNDGTLWTWGDDSYGKLGQNTVASISSPKQVGSGTDWSTAEHAHGSGDHHTIVVKTDGTMWGMGRNQMGQLGLGARDNGGNNSAYSSPTQISGATWSNASCCTDASAALKTDGTLWTWGSNSYGKLGLNESPGPSSNRSSPTQVPGTWTQVSGNGNFLGIKSGGTLWSWGFNREGQLGLNTQSSSGQFASVSSPKQIPGTWSDCTTGKEQAFAINSSGELFCWGRNQYGELGLNESNATQEYRSSPTQMGTDTTWSKVSSGTYSSYAIKTDGTLWAWGRNLGGSVGNNKAAPPGFTSSPAQVPGDWTAAEGMSYGVLALKST